jgi:hypothetical protein
MTSSFLQHQTRKVGDVVWVVLANHITTLISAGTNRRVTSYSARLLMLVFDHV